MKSYSSGNLWSAEFGKYQWIQYGLTVFPAFINGMDVFSSAEVAATPSYTCLSPNNETFPDASDQCGYTSLNGNITSCGSWEYDKSEFQTTIVTDWDLVCDKVWMVSLTQSVYMLGCLIAVSCFGWLPDSFGRRTVLVPSGALQLLFSLGCAFSPEYITYTVLRFATALCAATNYSVGFVMTMELAPERYRTAIGCSFQFAYCVGVAAIAGLGYAIQHWRAVQLAYTLIGLPMLSYFWFLDESPRWLFSNGRYIEADKILRKMLVRNKKADAIPAEGRFDTDQLRVALGINNTEQIKDEPSSSKNISDSKENVISPVKVRYGVLDLLRSPRLRLRLVIVAACWFANSIGYYGLSFSTGSLDGNPHLMLFLVGMVEAPAYLILFKVSDWYGRRSIISTCLCIGAITCIGSAFFPEDIEAWVISKIVVVMIAKCIISISFGACYNYTAELFPTVVRSSAIGITGSTSRIAGIVAPQILLLAVVDPKLPLILLGSIALISGVSTLFLPETNHKPLMNTIQEGEEFGRGDTCFSCRSNSGHIDDDDDNKTP